MNAKKMLFAGVCLLAACFTQAQESQMPKAFSYQAVVRNSQGKVIAKQPVGIKVEILQGSTEGTVVYAETQPPESSQTGTVNLLIGTGTVTEGTFADIDWGAATYFLRISMDVQGGSSYEVVSTTQMLPVPYALYAEKAGSVVDKESEDVEQETSNADYILEAAALDSYSPVRLYVALSFGEVSVQLMPIGSFNDPEGYIPHCEMHIKILYLKGENLDISLEIEGFKIVRSSLSSEYGRYYCFVMDESSRSVPTNEAGQCVSTIKILDKEGQILKEYPFTIKYEPFVP